MHLSSRARIHRAITPAGIGFIAGACLLILASAIPLIVLWGVGPVIVGSIVFATTSHSQKFKPWRAITALILSLPAYLLAFFAFAFTATFAQSHGAQRSGLISDLGTDMLCGLAAAILIACVEMEFLAWFLSGFWSFLHTIFLTGAGLVVLAITYGIGTMAKRIISHPSNSLQLWIFFGPMFLVGGAIVTALVHDQVVQPQSVAL